MSTANTHVKSVIEFVRGKTDTLTIFADSVDTPPIVGKMDAAIFSLSYGQDEPDWIGDYIEFECESFERRDESPFTNSAFLVKIKHGSLRLDGDPREYFGGLVEAESYSPFDDSPCPNCRGTGQWETECCSGAGGCSCNGQIIQMGACNACHGSGVMGGNYNKDANIEAIQGMPYIGSGPTS